MDILVKAKIILKLDDSLYHIGNRLYVIIKYKFDKKLFYEEEKLIIDLVDDGKEDWIWNRISKSEIMSVQEFVKKCEGIMSDMKSLEEKIKEKVIHDITIKHKNVLGDNSLKELKNNINNTKIKFTINIWINLFFDSLIQ